VNQLHEADNFIAGLIEQLSTRDEDTIVVFFGDHLPTMGLTDEDMKSGDIYKTKYITWNNMGLEKADADLYAYQLLASVTDAVGIHEGTIFNYHQTQADSVDYLDGLNNLQYDILYGSRYCYDGEDKYPATELVMGIDEVTINMVAAPSKRELAKLTTMLASEQEDTEEDAEALTESLADKILIRGSHFTKWSRVYVNGQKVSTTYVSSKMLLIDSGDLADGDTVVVSQLGSGSTVFRSSNEWIYSE
jgi:hypothetical protein